ncbi:MAG: glycosyltransferase [Crenarchaeota archaeon]|nr:MAG: glycosyltransferase [Thermoproteota archaeon]RDJ33357.1 MAG: glycosyltransferase [Thermoproteota archaeon]RDJ36139.1 MAG: glycosyltransferase [Thermoproteota archaeon]RDJ38771.1 MAG: glycosyltransferase [Thermoproteota archaeon]
MKILIGGASSKFFHLKEFGDELVKHNIEYRLVTDSEIYDGYPSRKFSHWFQTRKKFKNLVADFKPDAVFIDRQRHFGIAVVKENIPLLVHLRGDFWKEMDWASQTLYKSFPKNLALHQWKKIAHECFTNSSLILPICKHLENRVKEYYPQKDTAVFYQGINSARWYQEKGLELKHPCVGLLQGAVIWGKTKEMLTLKNVLEELPHVTFYWAGDGPYKDEVLSVLGKYDNFKWLGSLDYPDKVRQFLTEIDIYALISGIDMSPLTLLEAQLMTKPVIATNVGGIPELMNDSHTGFLINKGSSKDIIDKISIFLNDQKTSMKMGQSGKKFVEEKFSWDKITRDFIDNVKKVI